MVFFKLLLKTDKCRKWIQTLPSQTERFRVDDTPYTRELMLMELEKEPLGLGRGKVHINNEFLISASKLDLIYIFWYIYKIDYFSICNFCLQFITLVISLFCFLLNIRPKDEEESLIYWPLMVDVQNRLCDEKLIIFSLFSFEMIVVLHWT